MLDPKNCSHCHTAFEVTDNDLAFFDRIAPEYNGTKYPPTPPSLCPQCRWQRRLAYRNERTLYKRTCDLTGRSMISMHPADAPFPVYYITDWLGDGWDAKQYGRSFDFSKPFFEQLGSLVQEVPHFNLFIDPRRDVNSDYTNCASDSKNCYLISQAEENEDCFFSRGVNNCRDCCDCLRIHKCELCYECINLINCYSCRYCQDSDNCSDCYFSTDLRGCHHCFGCNSLVQKEYHIFNKPVSKAEWEKQVAANAFTRAAIAEYRAQASRIRLGLPQRATRLVQCEDCTGEHLNNCREAQHCFDSNDLEHCAYLNEVSAGARYCMDFSMWGVNAELLYECCGCGHDAYNLLFCNHCWNNVSYLVYCLSCFPSVKNCFGCFGLRQSEYCILNKQYSADEYQELVPQIIEDMRSSGEWGEFFPPALSCYGYNETVAYEYFPLERNQAVQGGWHWKDGDTSSLATGASTSMLPPDITIDQVDDSVLEQVYNCESSGKPFKLVLQELRFYRKMGLPLPTRCPEQRHVDRVQLRNPRQLWERFCEKCGEKIQSSYAPQQPEIIFCQECYLATVT
ncbi:hypothetical protein OAO01_07785 [Oligoflexia bacterium]|nr:hypothetical protein [Oligoflexia bacterium]